MDTDPAPQGIVQSAIAKNALHQNGLRPAFIDNSDKDICPETSTLPNGFLKSSKDNGLLDGYTPESEEEKMLRYSTESSERSSEIESESTDSFDPYRKDIDGGYAWVILAAAFTLNFFMSGQFGTLGIYLVEYLHYFHTTKATISYIGACQMFVGYFLGLFNGVLMKKFGCRAITMVSACMVTFSYVISAFCPNLWILYIFFGVIAGVGFLNFYLVAIVVVQQYFDKKRAFATGVCTSGLSVGIFVWSPFTRFLIDRFNWQGALLIQAGIFFNGMVCGALLRPRPVRPKLRPTNQIAVELQTLQKRPWWQLSCRDFLPFYIFLFGYFCIQLGHMTLYTYTPVKCDGINMPKTKASFLVSLMGITGIFARPVIGFLGDCSWANRTVLIGISAAIVGSCTMVSTQLLTYIPLAIFSGTFGFFSSGYMALYGAALVDIVGLNKIEVTSGALMVSKGTANLMLHLMSGWLMDITGDVNIPFLIFGAFQAIGGLLIIPIPWIKKCLRRRRTQRHSVFESQIF